MSVSYDINADMHCQDSDGAFEVVLLASLIHACMHVWKYPRFIFAPLINLNKRILITLFF